MRLQQDEQTSRLPTARRNSKVDNAPQRFRRRLDRWPSGGPWRIATPPAAPAATALDRGRRRRAAVRCHCAPAHLRPRAADNSASSGRREQKTYTVIIPVVRQNTPHSPQSPPSRQIRNFLQGVPCQRRHPDKEACHRLVLASLAPPTWLVPRAREGARVARRDQPYIARLRPRRPR